MASGIFFALTFRKESIWPAKKGFHCLHQRLKTGQQQDFSVLEIFLQTSSRISLAVPSSIRHS
jgi:hypothetical protein